MLSGKEKKKRSTKNLKVNTRIILSSVLAIVIPLVIIASFSPVFIKTFASYFNIASVTTNSYNTLNLVQWNQTLVGITDELISGGSDEEKVKNIQVFVTPLEKLNSVIYIEKNGETFYSTKDGVNALKAAGELIKIDEDKNINYFSDNGLVIISHAQSANDRYLIAVVNDDYSVYDVSEKFTAQDITGILLGRTGIIVLIIALLFVSAIVVISFIVTKTIVNPIKKIATGAEEIAKGNLDYEIEYDSTNELGQTVNSFNKMRERLKKSITKQQKAEDERTELVAGIAHDLRTPLTSAKGYAQGLIDGIASTPEKQKKYLETICSSIDDTEKILDDLLAISRLELNGYELKKTDVYIKEFINDGADEISFSLERAGFDFAVQNNCGADTVVLLDTDQFARVIRNIISNCIKYRRKDIKGRVEMNVAEYDKSVIIEVSDNGIGVDKENLPKIFDTMYRTDSARTKVSEGSGLGLAVCKQTVELHGGSIWASSKPGKGLSIFISLPKKEVF